MPKKNKQSVTKLENKLATMLVSRKMKAKPKKNKPFRDVGGTIGAAVSKMTGFKAATGIGRWLGSGIGSIFGSGDYQVLGNAPKYNVLSSSNQIPKFQNTQAGTMVCHREYIGDITGTTVFNNVAYPLNPGVGTTFPWLSSVASNYQQYRFHGLIFEFRPLITDFVTGDAPGVVIMATNYNADVASYNNKQQMENSEFAVSVKPTQALIHMVECELQQTVLPYAYVRTGAVPSTQDLRLYDLGNFQFATQSNPSQNLGELWVSYCVEFLKPILPADIGGVVTSGHAYRTNASGGSPLGATLVFTRGTLQLTTSTSNISFLAVPGQIYELSVSWQGIATSVTLPTFSFTGCTTVPSFNGGSNSSSVSPTVASTSTSSITGVFMLTSTLLTTTTVNVGVSGGAYPTSCNVDIFVTNFDANSL